MADAVRIFIGSGEASLLERKVLIYSLHKHSNRTLDIRVFNGTHDALERGSEDPQPLRTPLAIKYLNVTEFSNYRFMIPKLCGYQGRALWLDSDTVCLTDIGELFDCDMRDCDVLAKPEAYGGQRDKRWGLSVSLYDCARYNLDFLQCFDEVRRGIYSYTDLHQLTPHFRVTHPVRVGAFDPRWNVFDRYDASTKLIHYTNLLTQPWKFRGHPYGDLWYRYFQEARAEGFISEQDLETTFMRAYARQDLLCGNQWTTSTLTKAYLREAGKMVAGRVRRWRQ